MATDLVIDIDNTPGALAQVAAAISDAGVNIAAATCIGTGERAELHILVKHAEAAKHSLAISHLAVSREREVVVVDVEDRPGVLRGRGSADLPPDVGTHREHLLGHAAHRPCRAHQREGGARGARGEGRHRPVPP